MEKEKLEKLITNSNFRVLKKMVDDGLKKTDYFKLPFGTENICSFEKLRSIRDLFKEEGYNVDMLSEPALHGGSPISKYFLMFRS